MGGGRGDESEASSASSAGGDAATRVGGGADPSAWRRSAQRAREAAAAGAPTEEELAKQGRLRRWLERAERQAAEGDYSQAEIRSLREHVQAKIDRIAGRAALRAQVGPGGGIRAEGK